MSIIGQMGRHGRGQKTGKEKMPNISENQKYTNCVPYAKLFSNIFRIYAKTLSIRVAW